MVIHKYGPWRVYENEYGFERVSGPGVEKGRYDFEWWKDLKYCYILGTDLMGKGTTLTISATMVEVEEERAHWILTAGGDRLDYVCSSGGRPDLWRWAGLALGAEHAAAIQLIALLKKLAALNLAPRLLQLLVPYLGW